MIKNKVLHIKYIHKIYLKTWKIGKKHFRFLNKLLFYKKSYNNLKKLFFRIFFENNSQTKLELLKISPTIAKRL